MLPLAASPIMLSFSGWLWEPLATHQARGFPCQQTLKQERVLGYAPHSSRSASLLPDWRWEPLVARPRGHLFCTYHYDKSDLSHCLATDNVLDVRRMTTGSSLSSKNPRP
jgi:hypothetical protein